MERVGGADWRWAGATVFLLLTLNGGCVGAPPDNIPTLSSEDRVLNATLEAKNAASETFLALGNPGASTITEYTAEADLQGGSESRLAAIQDGSSVSWDFPLPNGLPAPIYLNLSKPIIGIIYVTNAASKALSSTDRGLDTMVLRVEVLSGTVRVGGAEATYNPGLAYHATVDNYRTRTWIQLPFAFRSEVHNLTEGAPLSVRISRQAGLADLLIGTGDNHQSFVAFHYFQLDPLAGVLYLEDGRLFSTSLNRAISGGLAASPPRLPTVTPPETTEPLSEISGGSPILPLLGASLMPFAGRRRSYHALIVAVFLAAALAGCATGPSAPEAGPTSGGTGIEPGEIRGIVLEADSNFQKPIAGASIGVVDFGNSTTTDARGEYVLRAIPPGHYVVRFQAGADYEATQRTIDVSSGRTTWYNVSLERPPGWSPDKKPHPHGTWPATGQLAIYSDTFTPVKTSGFVGEVNVGSHWLCGGAFSAGVSSRCETRIPVETSHVVPAGAGRVEVKLSWTGTVAPKEMGIRVVTSGNRSTEQHFLPRAQDVPFSVAFFPHEADPGHQNLTDWQFYVDTPMIEEFATDRGIGTAIDSITVSIVAFRGVTAYEPPHVQFWKGRDELPLYKDFWLPCFGADGPDDTTKWPSKDCAVPRPGDFAPLVPPGTKLIRGTLRWEAPNPDPGIALGIAYKAANVPDYPTITFTPAPTQTPGTESVSFEIPVEPSQVDQFYQHRSFWMFGPDDKDMAANKMPVLNGLWLYLTATAIKDPDFVEL